MTKVDQLVETERNRCVTECYKYIVLMHLNSKGIEDNDQLAYNSVAFVICVVATITWFAAKLFAITFETT